jgi:AcrR family transcriptional regulator
MAAKPVDAKATRTPLSRERVLAAAVALVDAEGVQALTMRRLAAGLGVEAMSLYHYLPAKQALLNGVVEAVVDEIVASVGGLEPAGDDEDWRARLRRQFLAARQVMLRHPWVPALLGTSRTVPAAVYAYYDGIVGTLVGAGFSYRLAHRALHAFSSLSLGFAQEIFSPDSTGAGLDTDAAQAEFAAMAEALPHLTAMVTTEIHEATDPTLGWCDGQVEFEFTLDLLLDGLERLRRRNPAE